MGSESSKFSIGINSLSASKPASTHKKKKKNRNLNRLEQIYNKKAYSALSSSCRFCRTISSEHNFLTDLEGSGVEYSLDTRAPSLNPRLVEVFVVSYYRELITQAT